MLITSVVHFHCNFPINKSENGREGKINDQNIKDQHYLYCSYIWGGDVLLILLFMKRRNEFSENPEKLCLFWCHFLRGNVNHFSVFSLTFCWWNYPNQDIFSKCEMYTHLSQNEYTSHIYWKCEMYTHLSQNDMI